MYLKDLIYKGVGIISVMYPEGEAREMIFAYMEDVFGIRKYDHVLDPDRTLTQDQTLRAMADFGRMASGEPLQYVTGKAHFYGRQFRVTPDVLIPRQETELLCNELLCSMIPKTPVFSTLRHPLAGDGMSFPPFVHNNSKPHSMSNPEILDLCTGSGCIAWTLALEMPGSQVTAVDISDGALNVALSQDFEEEISRAGALKPKFIKADVLQEPENCLQLELADILEQDPSNHPVVSQPDGHGIKKFDIVVSNPPYVMDSEKALMRTNVLDHEPHLALFVPDEDPLKFYRAVALWASKLLKDDGAGIVEINEALGKETAEIFMNSGFVYTEIIKDLHEKDRFIRFSKHEKFQKKRFF